MSHGRFDKRLAAALDAFCPIFAERSGASDESDAFAHENFRDLKKKRLLSAMVPTAYGGGGVSFPQMCRFLTEIARACPSTALTLSMHQHVVATSIVNASLGRPGEQLLRKVASAETLITTTVAKDWIVSSGSAVDVPGGYEVNAVKHFVSGAPGGDILMTSASITNSEGVPEVIHFAVPYDASGLEVCGNWKAHGMRATGSMDVKLTKVFVPEAAVTLKRAATHLPPLFKIILTVAPTLIMSIYVGIASRARELVMEHFFDRDSVMLDHAQLGKLEQLYATVELAHNDMISRAHDLNFRPTWDGANDVLIRKSIVTENVLATCDQCVRILGGASFLRGSLIERLLRDARAAAFHPMPTEQQHVFAGRMRLGEFP